jgi:bifunctional DNA-binding transcriptional regulator/antitoxin component of YhaV-PrlF toxin-antitoxin module
MEAHRAKLIEGGKLIIPAAMRRSLGLSTGDVVTIEIHDGDIRIRTLDKALARARAILRRHVPEGYSLVDELEMERRAEAEHD